MELIYLPVTTYPHLFKLAIDQTFNHNIKFEDYLELSTYIIEIELIRCGFIKDIAKIKSYNEKVYKDTITSLLSKSDVDWKSHHYSIFGLFILGEYELASKLSEKYFHTTCPEIDLHLDKLKSHYEVTTTLRFLNKIISQICDDSFNCFNYKLRIKSNSSLISKIILSQSFTLDKIINLNSDFLSNIRMPYDLVGIQIITKTCNIVEFNKISERIISIFKLNKIQLINQNVFYADWMNRISLIGYYDNGKLSVPFQIHLWDVHAFNYENMCYGNYKMKKLFIPIIKNWYDYLEKPLKSFEYSKVIVENLVK